MYQKTKDEEIDNKEIRSDETIKMNKNQSSWEKYENLLKEQREYKARRNERRELIMKMGR